MPFLLNMLLGWKSRALGVCIYQSADTVYVFTSAYRIELVKIRLTPVSLRIFDQIRVFCLEDLVEYFLSLSPLLVQDPEQTLILFVVGCFALNSFSLIGIQNLHLLQLVENGSQNSR